MSTLAAFKRFWRFSSDSVFLSLNRISWNKWSTFLWWKVIELKTSWNLFVLCHNQTYQHTQKANTTLAGELQPSGGCEANHYHPRCLTYYFFLIINTSFRPCALRLNRSTQRTVSLRSPGLPWRAAGWRCRWGWAPSSLCSSPPACRCPVCRWGSWPARLARRLYSSRTCSPKTPRSRWTRRCRSLPASPPAWRNGNLKHREDDKRVRTKTAAAMLAKMMEVLKGEDCVPTFAILLSGPRFPCCI